MSNEELTPNTNNQNPTPEPQPAPVAEPAPATDLASTQAAEPTPAVEPVPVPAPESTPEPTPAPVPESDPMPAIPVQPPKKPQNKKVLIALIIIVIALLVSVVVAIIVINSSTNKKSTTNNSSSSSQSAAADTSFTETYDLSTLTANLEITKAGVYELTGTSAGGYSVIVNANDTVTLYLNGVLISATQMAAIANITSNPLIIEIADDTTNTLSDGGASDYDGCIFSVGPLTINGDTGKLNVNGRQTEGEGIATEANDLTINGGVISVVSVDDGLNAGGTGGVITINGGELSINAGGDGIDSNKSAVINGGKIYVTGSSVGGDAGIDTDDGFTINGGILIALGSDMLETPEESSTQNSISFALENSYTSGSEVELLKDGSKILTFSTNEAFSTIILSSPDLSYGVYSLTINGETVAENISVIKSVTTYGNLNKQPGGAPAPNSDATQPADAPNSDAPESNLPESNGQDTYGRIPIDQLPAEGN